MSMPQQRPLSGVPDHHLARPAAPRLDQTQWCSLRSTRYPSGVIINDDNYEIACTWIDNDGTDGTKSSQVTLNFLEFYFPEGSLIPNNKLDTQYYCNYPAQYRPNDHAGKVKRDGRIVGRTMNEFRLVVSRSK